MMTINFTKQLIVAISNKLLYSMVVIPTFGEGKGEEEFLSSPRVHIISNGIIFEFHAFFLQKHADAALRVP
jgi:hypothetical protein